MAVICPKCGKAAWNPDTVKRQGKNPAKVYTYKRYRHPKRYKRNPVCYVPVKEAG